MRKINFNAFNDTVGTQIIDALYALHQSRAKDYYADVDIVITDSYDPNADFNAIMLHMPWQYSEKELEPYDLILLDNAIEPISVATTAMQELLNRDNCYLVCNSKLDEKQFLHHKVIWWPANFEECRVYWTRYFYPQLYENRQLQQLPRDKDLCFINGKNTSWRWHLIQLLKQHNINLNVHSVAESVHETNDSQFESKEDTEFRNQINNLYQNVIVRNRPGLWNSGVEVGINRKFGQVMPAYFILPEYYTHRCVIFPETSWQNYDLCITEKSLKCFYTGAIPWPIGGCGINQMYQALGFQTVWNLLPIELQKFDSTVDHMQRYQELIVAIGWLEKNTKVLQSSAAQHIISENRKLFMSTHFECDAVEHFDNVLRKFNAY